MRKLSKAEYDLIVHLLKYTPDNQHIIDKLPSMLVEEMNDGVMGSLKFLYDNKSQQRFGKQIAEISLLDKDGVPISLAINLDIEGNIYELDVFKADSSELVEFPTPPYNELPPSKANT